MAALAADANCSLVGVPTFWRFAASTAGEVFYKGAVIWWDLTSGGATVGQVQVASIAAGDRIVGICAKQQTSVAIGDLIEVLIKGTVWLPLGANIAALDTGGLIGADASGTMSDNPADLVHLAEGAADIAAAANDCLLGRIKEVTASQMLVQLENVGAIYGGTAAAFF